MSTRNLRSSRCLTESESSPSKTRKTSAQARKMKLEKENSGGREEESRDLPESAPEQKGEVTAYPDESSEYTPHQFRSKNVMYEVSAIEKYFMKGKLPQFNRARRKPGKRDKRGEGEQSKADVNLDTEEVEEEEEEEAEEKRDGRYAECSLEDVKGFFAKPLDESKMMSRLRENDFPTWTDYLAAGMNVLVHGVGSLASVFREYAKTLSEYTGNVARVQGFLVEVVEMECFGAMPRPINLIHALAKLVKVDSSKYKCKGNATEGAGFVARKVEEDNYTLIVILHRIDSFVYRRAGELEALQVLAAAKNVRLIASCSHLNRMLLWNTFLWKSLHANARKVLHGIYSMIYVRDAGDARSTISFWELFEKARDNFWVSSDAGLRQQLNEFTDHHLVRLRRSPDGGETIAALVERKLIESFLESKGCPLEEGGVPREKESL